MADTSFGDCGMGDWEIFDTIEYGLVDEYFVIGKPVSRQPSILCQASASIWRLTWHNSTSINQFHNRAWTCRQAIRTAMMERHTKRVWTAVMSTLVRIDVHCPVPLPP